MKKEKEEYRGFWFSVNTPKQVRDCIANCYDGLNTRVRIHQGDIETGRVWLEEHDVIGYVGRSTGSKKIPLLIHSKRSYGSGILDDCILGIQDVKTKRWLYKADNIKFPVLTMAGPQPRDEYPWKVGDDKECVAAFRTSKEAQNYIDFMRGKRMRVN